MRFLLLIGFSILLLCAWTVRYTLDGEQIGDCIEVSRTTTYVDWDCTVTLDHLTWFEYSLMQVGFNP